MAQHAVATLDHLGPHVIEEIREQRQCARILGRFLGCASRDIDRKPVGLKACGEQRGRAAHHLAQLRLTQRRHVDLPTRVEQGLVALQRAHEIRTDAHKRAQTWIAKTLHEDFREAPALAQLGPHIKLLALIDVQEKGRRLGLRQFHLPTLGLVEQLRQARFPVVVEQQFHPFVALPDAGWIACVELPCRKKCLDQGL
jgi:hypothetical protein